MEEKLILSSKQKAFKINLDNTIYGSMVEIGLDKRLLVNSLSRFASGTIAKTMSAFMIKIFQMQFMEKKKMVDMFVSLD